MKTTKAFLILALALSGVAACGTVQAGGSVHFGVVVGVPGPWYYPAPYYPPYYYPAAYPPVVVQQSAPVYVEQGASAAQPRSAAATGYWYYCADAKAYYPYVKDCPGGWQQVAASPPPQQPAR